MNAPVRTTELFETISLPIEGMTCTSCVGRVERALKVIHSDLQWHSVNALPSDTVPYVREALLCVARQQSYSEYGWDED